MARFFPRRLAKRWYCALKSCLWYARGVRHLVAPRRGDGWQRGLCRYAVCRRFHGYRDSGPPRGKVLVGGNRLMSVGLRNSSLAHARRPRQSRRAVLLRHETRGALPPQPLAHACDLLFEKVVLCEQLPQQKAVMIVKLSLQSALQLGYLARSLRWASLQHRYVFLHHQRFNHLASTPHHITGHRASLMLAVSNTF